MPADRSPSLDIVHSHPEHWRNCSRIHFLGRAHYCTPDERSGFVSTNSSSLPKGTHNLAKTIPFHREYWDCHTFGHYSMKMSLPALTSKLVSNILLRLISCALARMKAAPSHQNLETAYGCAQNCMSPKNQCV